jgi:hypothetical protein
LYHILRQNCLLKQVIEGKIKEETEAIRRRGRRRKKVLDDLKDRRGYSHLKVEALYRTMWRNRFGRGVGPVVRQNTEWMNIVFKNTAGNIATDRGMPMRNEQLSTYRFWRNAYKILGQKDSENKITQKPTACPEGKQ